MTGMQRERQQRKYSSRWSHRKYVEQSWIPLLCLADIQLIFMTYCASRQFTLQCPLKALCKCLCRFQMHFCFTCLGFLCCDNRTVVPQMPIWQRSGQLFLLALLPQWPVTLIPEYIIASQAAATYAKMTIMCCDLSDPGQEQTRCNSTTCIIVVDHYFPSPVETWKAHLKQPPSYKSNIQQNKNHSSNQHLHRPFQLWTSSCFAEVEPFYQYICREVETNSLTH